MRRRPSTTTLLSSRVPRALLRPQIEWARWNPFLCRGAERELLRSSCAVTILAGLMYLWELLHPVPISVFRHVDYLYNLALFGVAGFWCLHSTLRRTAGGLPVAGMRTAAMLLISLGVVSFGLGNAAWTWLVYHGEPDAPLPSCADAFYLAMYPLLLAGILMLPSKPIPIETRGRVILDALITLAAFGTFSWYYILGPTVQEGAGSLLAKLLAAAYPIGDLMLLICLLVLSAQSRNSVPPRVLAILGAGLASMILGDVIFAYRSLKNTYHEGQPFEALWPLGCLLTGMALQAVRRLTIDGNSRPVVAALDEAPVIPVLWRTLAPYCLLPLLAILMLHMRAAHGDKSLEDGVYLGTACVVVLVVLRQGAAMARLVRDLRERVIELEAAKSKLTNLAEIDGLTGLFNHRTLHAKVETEIAGSGMEPVALIAVDMDGFKAINDTHGHPTGDELLRYFALALQTVFANSAHVGRCGSDDFLVLLPCSDTSRAVGLIDELRQTLAEHPFTCPSGERIPVRVCFGVADTLRTASATQDSHTRAALLITAVDAALYESKQQGDGIVTVHAREAAGETGTGDGQNIDTPTRSSFDVLDGLITAIDNKDRFTRRHSEDVTRYSLIMVNALNLSEETVAAARIAGLLHDVGKIGIPDSILRKPGKLTAEEYEVMKSHVTISTLIIHNLPRLSDIIDGVAHHHERWDGCGYPNGVKGLDIPLLGRIMAIADAFSAMTLDRVYHAGMPMESALRQIQQGAGSQFDPELAALFLEVMQQNPQSVSPSKSVQALPKAA